jgi:Domain of unknown function (DUF4760)
LLPASFVWVILAYISAANAIFNVAALAFSFMAVLISVASARRQAADAYRANFITFVGEMGPRSQSQDFHKSWDYIMTELKQFDPALGVYGLPEPARDHVLLVAGFYQDVGVLVRGGVIDENMAAAMHYTRIKDAWRALGPYILKEREIRRSRGAGTFYSSFEHIAAYVESVPFEKTIKRFPERRFPANAANEGTPVGPEAEST